MTKRKIKSEEDRDVIYRLRKERLMLETYLLNTRRQMRVWISSQYTYCKKGNCKCTRGQPHGPFHYLFYKEGGKVRHRYIPQEKVESVQALAEVYKRNKQRLTRLGRINREMEGILRQRQEATTEEIPKWIRKKKK